MRSVLQNQLKAQEYQKQRGKVERGGGGQMLALREALVAMGGAPQNQPVAHEK